MFEPTVFAEFPANLFKIQHFFSFIHEKCHQICHLNQSFQFERYCRYQNCRQICAFSDTVFLYLQFLRKFPGNKTFVIFRYFQPCQETIMQCFLKIEFFNSRTAIAGLVVLFLLFPMLTLAMKNSFEFSFGSVFFKSSENNNFHLLNKLGNS